ncbi:MAG TPA: hypothetical protein PKE29_08655 [Phycisphaerales bacterium]|nr:hypothetical protein [Phycisphaerales bacterium]
MAESTTTPPPHPPHSAPGGDPISAFWRDVWARSGAAGGMAGMPGVPGMPGMGDPAGFMTPEAMRRMQGAFYEAMAQYAEQYMRSPQFLESMKKSMDQAMQLRQQMDDFLKSNMASAFESSSGGASSEILGAIRQSTAQLQAQIARIDTRVSDLESAVTGRPGAAKSARSASLKAAKPAKKSKPKR